MPRRDVSGIIFLEFFSLTISCEIVIEDHGECAIPTASAPQPAKLWLEYRTPPRHPETNSQSAYRWAARTYGNYKTGNVILNFHCDIMKF
jgi:hypothetical protein